MGFSLSEVTVRKAMAPPKGVPDTGHMGTRHGPPLLPDAPGKCSLNPPLSPAL